MSLETFFSISTYYVMQQINLQPWCSYHVNIISSCTAHYLHLHYKWSSEVQCVSMCTVLSTLVPGLSSGIIFLMVWCCIPPSLNGFKSMIYQKCAANCPSWGQLDLGPGTDWEISSNWNEREAFFCWERKRKLTFTFFTNSATFGTFLMVFWTTKMLVCSCNTMQLIMTILMIHSLPIIQNIIVLVEAYCQQDQVNSWPQPN